MKRTLVVTACIALQVSFVLPLQAGGFSKAGKSVFQFVRIGVGARQTAMGEAATATAADVNAAFWNPAGITGIGQAQASFTYTDWLVDLKYLCGAAAVRWNDVGVFAVNYGTLGYGDLAEAVVSIPGGGNDTRTGNTFTGGDLVMGLSFAREFTDRLSIGVSVKYLQEKLYVYKADAVAYDVGTTYDTGFRGLRLAMSAQNFGPTVSWLAHGSQEEGYDLPLTFRIGSSINVIDNDNGLIGLGETHRLILAADAVHGNDIGDRVQFGGEYVFDGMLALRGGYRLNADEGRLSLGLGLAVAVAEMHLRLDYAYVGYTNLNGAQRLTFTATF